MVLSTGSDPAGADNEAMNEPMPRLTLFYDGQCPLCRAEILWLQHRDRHGRLHCVDVTATGYDAGRSGVACDAALANMHARRADGTWLVGAEVFAEAYACVDLPWLAWLFSRPALQPFWRGCYRGFARHRHRIAALFGPALLRWVRFWIRRSPSR